jgi:hypothetical protein
MDDNKPREGHRTHGGEKRRGAGPCGVHRVVQYARTDLALATIDALRACTWKQPNLRHTDRCRAKSTGRSRRRQRT